MSFNDSSAGDDTADVVRCALEFVKNITQIEILFDGGNRGISSLEIEEMAGPQLDFLPQTTLTKMNGIETEVSLTMNQVTKSMFSQAETATTDAAESSPAIRLKFATPQPTVSAIILKKELTDGFYSGLNVRLYVSSV